ncbi:DUF3987 domain-containing protein [Embleya sp. NBC_00896]|uniref:DUF3987 domain-containing protein n=1 Tax=Embleya sp. NBC_00896 TaxID=2975961 RepID=UPI003870E762|nr:DUF3987 domain-containing protein [Embleya sp. NBC_00896]
MTAIPFERPGAPDDMPTEGVACDIDAERSVLGAAMLDAAVIPEIETELGAPDTAFYRPAHASIWRAIRDLVAAGEPTDAVAVAAHLTRAGVISRVGGAPYLHTCISSVPTAANGPYYARIVAEQARLRRIAEAGVRLVQAAGSDDPDEAHRVATNELRAVTESVREEWPDPIPLGGAALLPPFPVASFPPWVGEFVAAVAEETQTPPDLAAVVGLSCLATAAGGRVVVRVKGQWCEPLNLFTAAALPPGNRKSAVFDLMTGPILAVEKAMEEEAKAAVIEAKALRAVAEETAQKAATKAANADAEKRAYLTAEALDLAQAAAAMADPVIPQLVADDSTPETVATLLATHGGRLAVLSAEGGIFDIIAGRYSSGSANLDVYLKGHAGDMIKVNRHSRREYVRNPALTIGLACQPDVLRTIGDQREFAGRGLLARFLYSIPESWVGYRDLDPDPIPAAVLETYHRNLSALTRSLATTDAEEPAVITVSPEAGVLFKAFQERLEPQLRPRDGALGHVATWASKLAGAVARIAGLLHLAEHLTDGWDRPVHADSMAAAIAAGDYFVAHALAAFELMGTDVDLDLIGARLVHGWLKANPAREVSHTAVFKGVRCRDYMTSRSIDPALTTLEEFGWLQPVPPPDKRGRGRPPAKRYLLHPTLRDPRTNR